MIRIINSFLNRFDYKIEKKYTNKNRSEGYPSYLEAADKLNLDVNDYLNNNMGWPKPKPIVDEILFPLLENIPKPNILELGPGTGRWTRYILEKANQLKAKEYYLIDHAVWMIDFLSNYFKNETIVKVIRNDGLSLPVKDSFFDMAFSEGLFIQLKPGNIYLYAKEFSRVLKPGGYCVFDYYNCDNEEGWDFFVDQSNKKHTYFTFYPDHFIEKIFITSGFLLEKRVTYGKSIFVIFKKK